MVSISNQVDRNINILQKIISSCPASIPRIELCTTNKYPNIDIRVSKAFIFSYSLSKR